MNFASWNVKGLNESSHQKELKNFISSNHNTFMGVSETKVKKDHANVISAEINNNWKLLFNYDHHYNVKFGWAGIPLCGVFLLFLARLSILIVFLYFRRSKFPLLFFFVYAFKDGCDRVPI